MTSLTKPVLRKVCVSSLTLRRDPLIFTLHPAGFIGVRESGRRSQYKIDLKTVVTNAVHITTAKVIARTKELRKMGVKNPTKKARKEILQTIEK